MFNYDDDDEEDVSTKYPSMNANREAGIKPSVSITPL
jgi:hypothetical protein